MSYLDQISNLPNVGLKRIAWMVDRDEAKAIAARADAERRQLVADNAALSRLRDALIADLEQAEARLAAIDSAPTVGTVRSVDNGAWDRKFVDYDGLPPIGTELIARPAKETK